MKNRTFTVLRGGLSDTARTSGKQFESAYVTNTRLMGVLGMYIRFSLPDNQRLTELHQFFYFDAEEYGFESYRSIFGPDPQQVIEADHALTGGLGGKKIPISLREACFLLQEYVRFNRKHGLPLPDGYDEYSFLLEDAVILSEPEHYILMQKQCVTCESPLELINYFLMRVIGRDFGAAALLTAQNFPLDLFPEFGAGTFCKNTIDRTEDPDTYLCESLLEFTDSYYLAVTSVTVKHNLVYSSDRISLFRISPPEAAMMLTRSEFIAVYEMLDAPASFTPNATALSETAMTTVHEHGTLYMMFHPSNKHVDRREYRLSEDVLGMYYISFTGQLIAAAYSLDEIRTLEQDLGTAEIGKQLVISGRYEFQNPVLYDFIQSGIQDFSDFIDTIS